MEPKQEEATTTAIQQQQLPTASSDGDDFDEKKHPKQADDSPAFVAQQKPKQMPRHSHSESASSSSSGPDAGHPAAAATTSENAPVEVLPKDPPKIPPPPSEHPPPYTPFGGQTASLLPGAQPPRAQGRSNRRGVLQPSGLHKYLQYCTACNLLIALAILFALCLLAYLIHWSNRSDEEIATEHAKPLEQHHRALEFYHKGLGAIKGNRDRISFDGNGDVVILSEFDAVERVLVSELVKVDDHLDGFQLSRLGLNQLEKGATAASATGNATNNNDGLSTAPLLFDKCMRLSVQLICCATSRHAHQHLTKCFLHEQSQNATSIAAMYDFLPRWQALSDGEVLQLVRNVHGRHAVLDVRRNILHQIEEDQWPLGAVFNCFYFPRQTADELTELVRLDNEFRMCEFVRKRQVDQEHGVYALKDENCRSTLFTLESDLSRVLFCTNALYTAVVQYGHLPNESAMLTWRLRVKFHALPDMFSTGNWVHGLKEQMAMNCEDERLQLFILGDHELHEFTVPLREVEMKKNGAESAEDDQK